MNAGETLSLHRSLSSSVVKPPKLEFDCHLSRQGSLSGAHRHASPRLHPNISKHSVGLIEFPCHIGDIGVVNPIDLAERNFLMFSWAPREVVKEPDGSLARAASTSGRSVRARWVPFSHSYHTSLPLNH